MKACGLIVEYNPFHNGHLHHINAAKEKSNADILIAVMSGPFLQRGEPAIIDKFHRTRAALASGADIVLELPYAFAVQSSELFAKGAVHSLHQLGVHSICFGSEVGDIAPFIEAITTLQSSEDTYKSVLKAYLDKGYAYPLASDKAYEAIGMNSLDVMQPNNILGLSYTKTIINDHLAIKPITIPRLNNQYHDEVIEHTIASATSIRKELYRHKLSDKAQSTLTRESMHQLQEYKRTTSIWHHWEHYFPFLHYKVMTMEKQHLATIFGVDEGLENRIMHTATKASSFANWMERIKTKRYTQTRLQRMFVHILTDTKKEEIEKVTNAPSVTYLRLLGMSHYGRDYINKHKQDLAVPIITNLKRNLPIDLTMDERATDAYYSILQAEERISLRKQEFTGPLFK